MGWSHSSALGARPRDGVERRRARRAVFALWSLVTVSGCARVEDQLRVWLPLSRPIEAAGKPGATPQRFFVLNVDAEQSRLTLEPAGAVPDGANVGSARPAARASTPVAGQLVIDPEDLSRSSGLLSSERLVLRLRQVTIAGPKTLADLVPPNSRVNLLVTGDLTYDGETSATQLELVATADITAGKLNGLRVATVRPLGLPSTFVALSMRNPASGPETSGVAAPTIASLALIAKPSLTDADAP